MRLDEDSRALAKYDRTFARQSTTLVVERERSVARPRAICESKRSASRRKLSLVLLLESWDPLKDPASVEDQMAAVAELNSVKMQNQCLQQ